MKTDRIIIRMIDFYEGNVHDINHFLKVYAYAKIIGEAEGLDESTMNVIEAAAAVHDIACPLCREKYGAADGRHQEIEGPKLARRMLSGMGLEDEFIERVCWLVGHHHTAADVRKIDHQILVEADYIVNADEADYSKVNIKNERDRIFRTHTGKVILNSIYMD